MNKQVENQYEVSKIIDGVNRVLNALSVCNQDAVLALVVLREASAHISRASGVTINNTELIKSNGAPVVEEIN